MIEYKLDAIDLRILSEIQDNARITNARLSDKIGLSTGPTLQRVRRLEKFGYIKCYQGMVDLAKITPVVQVLTEITLARHHREDFERFEAALADEATVLECHMVSGGFDYLVKFLVRHIGHYQAVMERLSASNLGITKYFSYIVVKTPIELRPPDISIYT
ncbi:MAG: Lrp/AsnC family transcriptional regulator [Acidobacteriota bacterium]|nr:Lrp/AsnC family transcriptional regulator [Acidobacteriota bacterium]